MYKHDANCFITHFLNFLLKLIDFFIFYTRPHKLVSFYYYRVKIKVFFFLLCRIAFTTWQLSGIVYRHSKFGSATILDKIKWNSKPPSPPNQGWRRAKGKNAPFSHPWFGGKGGSRFSIYFVQDCSSDCGLRSHLQYAMLLAVRVLFLLLWCTKLMSR